jgi:hypothetical protein
MIKPITVYRTSSGMDFPTAEEAQAHELGCAIEDAIIDLIDGRHGYDRKKKSLYSAAHNLAKDHPKIARRVLDALAAKDDDQ